MDFYNFFFIFPIFGLIKPDFREKSGFLLGGPTTKKTLFYLCLP